MGVTQGNLWSCDSPECKKTAFVPRVAQAQVPKDWLNCEVMQGAGHAVACGPDCLGPAVNAVTEAVQAAYAKSQPDSTAE